MSKRLATLLLGALVFLGVCTGAAPMSLHDLEANHHASVSCADDSCTPVSSCLSHCLGQFDATQSRTLVDVVVIFFASCVIPVVLLYRNQAQWAFAWTPPPKLHRLFVFRD